MELSRCHIMLTYKIKLPYILQFSLEENEPIIIIEI